MKRVDEILSKLPSSWDDFKLRDFIKTLDIKIEESEEEDLIIQPTKELELISKIADVPMEELMSMSIQDINKLVTKILFVQEPPKEINNTLGWKNMNEITYDNYVEFLQYKDDVFNNLPSIIKIFSKDNLSIEQIEEKSMREVYSAFFTLNKRLKKSMTSLVASLAMKLAKQTLRETWQTLTRRNRNTQTK